MTDSKSLIPQTDARPPVVDGKAMPRARSEQSSPTVAVVIPVWNRAACVGEAIDSVLRQTSPVDEIIVVDDGSTDGTAAALARYGDAISVISQGNAGVSAARNTGVARARQDWIAFLDSDDVWRPDRIEILRRDLRNAQIDVGVHVGDVRIHSDSYDRNLFALRRFQAPVGGAQVVEDPLALALPGLFVTGSAMRRDWFLAENGFDADLRIYEDLDLFARLALRGAWLVTGDVVAEAIRRSNDDAPLSALETTRHIDARRSHAEIVRRLLERSLSAAQRALTRRHSSVAELRLARALASVDPIASRASLLRSAKAHPSALKGWLRILPPLFLGQSGFGLVLPDPDFRRS